MAEITFKLADGSEKRVQSKGGFTLMEAAVAVGVDGIDAICGGGCSCGTCHVHILSPDLSLLDQPSAFELELLAIVQNSTAVSRLACQVTLSEAFDRMEVFVPSPNGPE